MSPVSSCAWTGCAAVLVAGEPDHRFVQLQGWRVRFVIRVGGVPDIEVAAESGQRRGVVGTDVGAVVIVVDE